MKRRASDTENMVKVNLLKMYSGQKINFNPIYISMMGRPQPDRSACFFPSERCAWLHDWTSFWHSLCSRKRETQLRIIFCLLVRLAATIKTLEQIAKSKTWIKQLAHSGRSELEF
jgi:hypothetical protein